MADKPQVLHDWHRWFGLLLTDFFTGSPFVVEIERDFTTYGDEAVFGGGKVIRDAMGQHPTATREGDAVLDTVITNATIVDAVAGICKADVGIRDGRIAGIGKSGNPWVMNGVTPGMIIGASTEVIAGENHILTAGAIDAHIHFICPQQVDVAITSGVTTMLGGGTGPASGTNATTCTPRLAMRRTSSAMADGSHSGMRPRGISRSGWAPAHSSTIQLLYACTDARPSARSFTCMKSCPANLGNDGKQSEPRIPMLLSSSMRWSACHAPGRMTE